MLTAQVPVIQIFQPLAKTSRTGAFRFPVNRLVQRFMWSLQAERHDEAFNYIHTVVDATVPNGIVLHSCCCCLHHADDVNLLIVIASKLLLQSSSHKS